MNPIKVMVNGLPGNVASIIAEFMAKDERFELLPHSLTGPGIEETSATVGGVDAALHLPPAHEQILAGLKESEGAFIIVDYTHPSAVNANAQLYCRMGLPFVMGTTGGDREALVETVRQSAIPAVIAPNMAKQIVGFQAMMEYAAETFPGLFEGYTLAIEESHQQGKADTSGTAKAMVGYFNKMGIPFDASQILQVRDPEIQKNKLGVPPEHLGGHGWHTYTLLSPDQTVKFAFTHNVNGRKIYCGGTGDAVLHLNRKIAEGVKGQVISMIDVLKGA